jgi:hypothetical protein
MTDFNLNSQMAVTLTAYGHKILEAFNAETLALMSDDLVNFHKEQCAKRLSGNVYFDQAWRVMLIFGPQMSAGPDEGPFKTAIVQIDL